MVGVAGAVGVAGEAAIGAAIAYDYVGQTFDTANPDEADHAEPPGSWCAGLHRRFDREALVVT